MSNFVIYSTLCILASKVSMLGNGYLTGTIFLLTDLRSTHSLREPLGFRASTTGLTHLECSTFSIILADSNFSTSCSSKGIMEKGTGLCL